MLWSRDPYWVGISTPYRCYKPKSQSPKRLRILIFTFLLLVGCTSATVVDNILNNLGSDLAPLLALFGEKVTMQYLGESLTWIDNFIFALAPLGIITAMVSAVRVAGGPRLRSLIGRAKESRGTVEAELMSSTSSDVCELWNGQGVVRVPGCPVLLQLVYVPSKDPLSQGSPEIYTFAEAVKENIYSRKPEAKLNPEADLEASSLLALENPPNLSPNISTKPLSERWLLIFGVLGACLQSGVLVFAALIQYQVFNLPKNDEPTPDYAFPIIACGTLLLAMGMFLCAQIIEQSTEEAYWEPASKFNNSKTTEVIWLQRGGQMVGDQLFGSFAKRSENFTVMTSAKRSEKFDSGKSREVRVWIALSASFLGFVTQFIGFRAIHPYVTLVQLAVVLFMTIIRSFAHIERKSQNAIENPDSLGDGHELDWLAKSLKGCKTWEIVTGIDSEGYSVVPKSPTQPDPNKCPSPLHNQPTVVMKNRARLAQISSDWKLENRIKVKTLKSAIEATMNQVCASMTLKPGYEEMCNFDWTLWVKTRFCSSNQGTTSTEKDKEPEISGVDLRIVRERDDDSWTPWRIDENELEAVLCLWVSSLVEEDKLRARSHNLPLKNVRLFGPATDDSVVRTDYKLWIYNGTALNESREDPGSRYFGWAGKDQGGNATYLSIDAKEDLATLCAQEIYGQFLFQLAQIVEEIGGNTTLRKNDPATDIPIAPIGQKSRKRFCLFNSNIAALASLFSSSGLGSIENAYISIIPALRASGKLPVLHKVHTEIQHIQKDRTSFDDPRDNLEGRTVLQAAAESGLEDIVAWLLDIGTDVNGSAGERTALELAAKAGHETIVKLLIDRGADVVAQAGISRRTALQAAAESGHLEIVRYLLEHGADINAPPGITGRTALQAAAGNGHEGVVILLLEHGAEIDAVPARSSGRTALQAAAGGGHERIVLHLLKSGADLSAEPAPNLGRTALQAAAEGGYRSIVKHLLGYGAQINGAPAKVSGRSAMQAAAEGGHLEIVRDILNHGVLVSDVPAEIAGRRAIEAAAGGGHLETVQYLLDRGAQIDTAPARNSGRTALQAAAEGGHLEMVQFLLGCGAKVDSNDAPAEISGRTALQAAAEAGHKEVVLNLVDHGAQVDVAPAKYSGRTALQAAAGGGHLGIVQYLLNHGAQLNGKPAEISGRSALQAAAGAGHLEIVKHLLDRGAQIDAAPAKDSGRTTLQAAAEGGHLGVVRHLLDHGAKVDNDAIAEFSGRSALQAAAGAGCLEVVVHLLGHGAQVDAAPKTSSGRTALQAAAEGGHLEIVQYLLGHGADADAEPSPDSGRTALQAAAGGGHLELVQYLLDHGVQIDAAPAEISGRTALQAAAEGGHLEIVQHLFCHGVQLDEAPAKHSGRAAIQAAAGGGHLEIVQYLLDNHAKVDITPAEISGRTALQAAAESGHEMIVDLLLEQGADVNATLAPESGTTALLAAAKIGHIKIVESLLSRGADINAISTTSAKTALQAAVEMGHTDTIQLFLIHGADTNIASTVSGRTALQAAAEGGHLEIVQYLLAYGADVNAASDSGSGPTALQIAMEAGHTDIVRLLLGCEVDVNAVWETSGQTALQTAAGMGNTVFIRLLLDQGADVNAAPAPDSGRTALQAAAEGGHVEVVEWLLSLGADVNAPPAANSGVTALEAAVMGGHQEVVEVLRSAGAREEGDDQAPIVVQGLSISIEGSS